MIECMYITCTDSNCLTNFVKKLLKNDFGSSETLQTQLPTLCGRYNYRRRNPGGGTEAAIVLV